MKKSKKNKQVHKMYKKCKKIFKPSLILSDVISDTKDKEEREFLIVVSDYFLQQKQKKAIKEGIF